MSCFVYVHVKVSNYLVAHHDHRICNTSDLCNINNNNSNNHNNHDKNIVFTLNLTFIIDKHL